MKIVGEPLRTLLQSLMCHTEQCRQFLKLLTPEQKEHRVAICQELRQLALDDPSFMSRVITGDWRLLPLPEDEAAAKGSPL